MASNHSIDHILKPGSTTAASAASLPAAAAVNLPALQPIYPLRFTPPLYSQQLQLIQPQVLPCPPALVPMPQPPPALIPVGTGDEESTRCKDQKKNYKNDQKDQNSKKKDQKKKRKRKREKSEEQLNGRFFAKLFGFSCILFL